MLVEFSIVSIGKGDSLSGQVAEVIRIVERSGIPYRVNPMGTVIEGEWDRVMGVIKECHMAVLKAAPRVLTRISIDDRPGKPYRMDEKIRSVESKLGREVRK